MENYPKFYVTSEQDFKTMKTLELVHVECQYCKTIFSTAKKNVLSSFKYKNKIVQFCSQKCSVGNRSGRNTEDVNCLQCNKEFSKTLSEIKKSKNHFCSQSCAATFNNKNRGIYQKCEKTGNVVKVLKPLQQCINCDKSFKKTHFKQVCCSMICTMEHHNKNTIAASICKRDGANRYDAIRKSARSYSLRILPHNCANCGYDKHFEVCHIIPIKDFNLSEVSIFEINNKQNLIHLCPNCHWELDNGHLSIKDIK